MTTQEINKRLYELLGNCWHEPDGEAKFAGNFICKKCRYVYWANTTPDYCADPRLVIKAMMERKDWPDFLRWFFGKKNRDAEDLLYSIMDTTGKLALLAIEYLEGRK
jgi:hypothetical protein